MSRLARTMIVFAAAIALLALAGMAQASSWNAATGWTDQWTATNNAPWSYLFKTLDTGSVWSGSNINSYYGTGTLWNFGKSDYEGHGWGESYWCPFVLKNTSASAVATSIKIWTYEGDWSSTESVHIDAGGIALGANGAYITQNRAGIRWTAPVAGSGNYLVTATFTGARTSGGQSSGVNIFVNGGNDNGAADWTQSITAYQQVQTYTATIALTAGQTIDAVVTGRDYVDLAFTVTDAPVPEPGSMMVLATGLVGLLGFGVRRRKS